MNGFPWFPSKWIFGFCFCIHPLKLTANAPENRPKRPKRKGPRLPASIHFQVPTCCSFQGGDGLGMTCFGIWQGISMDILKLQDQLTPGEDHNSEGRSRVDEDGSTGKLWGTGNFRACGRPCWDINKWIQPTAQRIWKLLAPSEGC